MPRPTRHRSDTAPHPLPSPAFTDAWWSGCLGVVAGEIWQLGRWAKGFPVNIVIPPKIVAFLRYLAALVVAIPVGYTLGTGSGGLYGLYLPFLLLFCVPWVAMIAPKREIVLGFFMATLAWGNLAFHQRLYENRPLGVWLAEDAEMYAFTCVLSLIGTVPIQQWRKWCEQGRVSPVSQRPYYVEQDSDIQPPYPRA